MLAVPHRFYHAIDTILQALGGNPRHVCDVMQRPVQPWRMGTQRSERAHWIQCGHLRLHAHVEGVHDRGQRCVVLLLFGELCTTLRDPAATDQAASYRAILGTGAEAGARADQPVPPRVPHHQRLWRVPTIAELRSDVLQKRHGLPPSLQPAAWQLLCRVRAFLN